MKTSASAGLALNHVVKAVVVRPVVVSPFWLIPFCEMPFWLMPFCEMPFDPTFRLMGAAPPARASASAGSSAASMTPLVVDGAHPEAESARAKSAETRTRKHRDLLESFEHIAPLLIFLGSPRPPRPSGVDCRELVRTPQCGCGADRHAASALVVQDWRTPTMNRCAGACGRSPGARQNRLAGRSVEGPTRPGGLASLRASRDRGALSIDQPWLGPTRVVGLHGNLQLVRIVR